jgi:hypothetical protein
MEINKKYASFRGLLLLITVFIISSCKPFEIKEFKMSPTIPDIIPIKVGLNLSPKFCNYLYTYKYGGQALVGPSLCKSATSFFKETFKEVILLNGNIDILRDIKAIIFPEIVEIIFTGNMTATSRIIFKWTVVSPSGKVYYLNTLDGIGMDDSLLFNTRVNESFTNAVNDHYKKLHTHMISSKWWENIE